jgi:Vault protein inter-alpha-trypsin domain
MPRSSVFLALLVSTAVAAGLQVGHGAGGAKAGAAPEAAGAIRGAVSGEERPVPAAPPVQLTASDGTGLSLVGLEVNAVLEPPLAFTELHLTFENPRDARIEGRFRIALPAGAALSRFAMKGDSGWQEGEVVERQRARLAYEDFLHRRQDPALLEQEAGNEFSARVFPIPARGRKELILSYSHALPRPDQPYVVPLLGLSAIGRLDVRVLLGDRPAALASASNLGGEVSDRRVVELHRRDWTPDRDLEVGQERAGERVGLRNGNLVVVRVAPQVAAARQAVTGLYVLVDSSASRALGYREQVRRLAELIDGLRHESGSAMRLGIAAFDQEVVPLFEGVAADFGPDDKRRLLARRPLGASDLHGALTWLAGRLARSRHGFPRVLLITDGMATAGDTATRSLKAATAALAAPGVERLDVLAVGGLRDEVALRELVTGNLPRDGVLIAGAAPGDEVLRRMTLECRSRIAVTVPGAAWVWPETLDGIQPGDEALVYADLPAERPPGLALDGREVALAGRIATVERPLLARAWAQARIERLLHLRESAALARDEDLQRALGLEIVELSVHHRVLSPYTAMLVLESAADYARFGLDRRALADILTVGAGGLEVLARGPVPVPPAPSPEVAGERLLDATGLHAAGARPEPRPLPESRPAPADHRRRGGAAATEEAEAEAPMPMGAGAGIAGGVAGGVLGGVPAGASSDASAALPADSAGEIAESSPPAVPRPLAQPPAIAPPVRAETRELPLPDVAAAKRSTVAAYSGRFAAVMADLGAGRRQEARLLAEAWSAEEPGDVLALIALGESWEAAGEKAAAARAYGSLIDLFPSRADLRRLAAERLERLGDAGLPLAIDSYDKAVEQRPDHPSGHRLLAWSLWRAGRFGAAFAALEKGIEHPYPPGRFPGVDRVLREDLGLLAAAWLRAEPARRQEILDRLRAHGARLATEPSLRFVLSWETDANDVDLHVYDRGGDEAYYGHPRLASGGELFADVTTGYGPECFAVPTPGGPPAAPYRVAVHYYSRGPMGYGMGTVQIVAHDGRGGLRLDPRPFVVMSDDAMVDLGLVEKPKGKKGAP